MFTDKDDNHFCISTQLFRLKVMHQVKKKAI